tara:strand:- start:112 stop:930 length:819 start_codon:yes stop_codon:yes gene_type:complete
MEDIRKSFFKSNVENWFEVDGLPIALDDWFTNISIDLSGGADSALMAYLLMTELKKRNVPDITNPGNIQGCKVHLIYHHRGWKTKPWQIDVANRVIEWLNNYYPVTVHRNFIPEKYEDYNLIGEKRTAEYVEIDEYRKYLVESIGIDMHYNATTSHYPFASRADEYENRNREEIDPYQFIHYKNIEAQPFLYITKDWIVKQYIDHNIMDLFNLTRSCEGNVQLFKYQANDGIIDDFDYKKGDNISVTCNQCYWCEERNWAIEQNKNDKIVCT